MAEVQESVQSGELTQRFIEFVMMQAQQAALCLGRMPHPATGEASVNLAAARMFIDHLELIREKTRGNLNKEEGDILNGIISELQLAFVQVSQKTGDASPISSTTSSDAEASATIASPLANDSSSGHPVAEPSAAEAKKNEGLSSEEVASKKKFSKSYGS